MTCPLQSRLQGAPVACMSPESREILRELALSPVVESRLLRGAGVLKQEAVESLLRRGMIRPKGGMVFLTLDGRDYWDWAQWVDRGVPHVPMIPLTRESHWLPLLMHVIPAEFHQDDVDRYFSDHRSQAVPALGALIERQMVQSSAPYRWELTPYWLRQKERIRCEFLHD